MEETDRLDDEQNGGWVSISSGTGSPGQSRTKGRKTVVTVVQTPTTGQDVSYKLWGKLFWRHEVGVRGWGE